MTLLGSGFSPLMMLGLLAFLTSGVNRSVSEKVLLRAASLRKLSSRASGMI
jgi:hypothetical protein